ncbi:unnamed protein product, partial [Ascophyllum nodosum]
MCKARFYTVTRLRDRHVKSFRGNRRHRMILEDEEEEEENPGRQGVVANPVVQSWLDAERARQGQVLMTRRTRRSATTDRPESRGSPSRGQVVSPSTSGSGTLPRPSEEEPGAARVVCVNCGDGGSEDRLILCDGLGCENGAHTYCCGLAEVPSGEWFCPSCQASRDAADRRDAILARALAVDSADADGGHDSSAKEEEKKDGDEEKKEEEEEHHGRQGVIANPVVQSWLDAERARQGQ